MAHAKHAPSSFADNGKRLFEQFVENFLEHFATLSFDFLLAVGIWEISIRALRISSRRVANRAETLLNSSAELGSFAAEFVVRESLHLRLERVDLRHTRLKALDLALVLRPENLA
jgi:hypothetical protein